MSDRTYNNIDIDVYSKPWSKCARRIWAHILILQPNLYGIFDSPLGAILDFWEDMYEQHKIMEAIAELKKIGCLKTYRDGDLWWVVKKFKRSIIHQMAGQHRMGVEIHLKKYPEVRKDFTKVYHDYFESFTWQEDKKSFKRVSQEVSKSLPRASKEVSKRIESPSHPLGNSDTDSDTELKKSKKAKPAKVKAADIPTKSLAELEETVPAEAFDAWVQWKQTCCASNKTGEMAESRLANLLGPVLKSADKLGLSGDALAYGFLAAVNAKQGQGAANSNYVITSAKGYTPDKSYSPTIQPTTYVEAPASFVPPGGK